MGRNVHDQGLKIRSDNTTTVAYINHGGGTKSTLCNQITKDIWKWCETKNVWIIAGYVPGKLNIEADYESRHFSEDTEWELSDYIFRSICDKWGVPEIDLFASRLNNKVPLYASWGPDPDSLFVNAFTEDWSAFKCVYIFPPFRLLIRALQKVKKEAVRAIIVAPDWMGQPWTSPLRRAAKEIMKFPRREGNLHLRGNQDVTFTLQNIPLVAHHIF